MHTPALNVTRPPPAQHTPRLRAAANAHAQRDAHAPPCPTPNVPNTSPDVWVHPAERVHGAVEALKEYGMVERV